MCVCFDQNTPVFFFFFFMPLSRKKKLKYWFPSDLIRHSRLLWPRNPILKIKRHYFCTRFIGLRDFRQTFLFSPLFSPFYVTSNHRNPRKHRISCNLRCNSRIYTRRKINWWLRKKTEYLIGDFFYKYNCPQITHKQFIF